MKKIGYSVVVVLLALLMAGCGKKQTLACTQTAEGIKVNLNVGFKGSVVTSMDYSYETDLSQYSDAQIEAFKKQDFCTVIKESMADYKDAFANCKHDIKDKQLVIAAELDVTKIAKDTADRLAKIETAKEALEAQGYNCTIK